MPSSDFVWTLDQVGGVFYALLFAPLLLIVLVKRQRGKRRWFWPILVAVFAAWACDLVYQLFIDTPLTIARAQAGGDFYTDNVGANVFTLLFGWLFPLIGCGLVWATWVFYSRRNLRKQTPNRSPEPPPSAHSP